MSWQVLILLSVLTYSVSVLLQRVLVKEDKNDPIAFFIVFSFLTGMLIGAYGYLTQNMSMPNIGSVGGNLLLTTLLYGFGNIFLFKALKKIEASIFTIIFSSRALFTILASSILLSESFTTPQWVGALCIFAGIILVTGKIKKISITKYEIFTLLAGIGYGFANTNDRIILKTLHVYPYVFIGFLLPIIPSLLLYPKSLEHIKIYLRKKVIGKLLFLCLIYAVGSLMFFVALQKAPNSSQVATINLTSVIVIVLLSIILLKEHTDWLKKITGAVLSFVGLLLLT